MAELTLDRQQIARRGKRLEYFTIAWNSLEGVVAVIAGAFAGSISLVGFGINSFIEVTSGVAVLWRMSVDSDIQRREKNECTVPPYSAKVISWYGFESQAMALGPWLGRSIVCPSYFPRRTL